MTKKIIYDFVSPSKIKDLLCKYHSIPELKKLGYLKPTYCFEGTLAGKHVLTHLNTRSEIGKAIKKLRRVKNKFASAK